MQVDLQTINCAMFPAESSCSFKKLVYNVNYSFISMKGHKYYGLRKGIFEASR